MAQFPLNLHLYKIFMTIEPEALYSMFDILIVPIEIIPQTDKKAKENTTTKQLLMLFEKEYTEDEKDFLNKILGAINIKPEEVETKFGITASGLPEIIEANSGYILIWGLNFQEAQNYKFYKKVNASILVIDSLTAIKNDQSLKGKLWNCLKEEFVK